MSNPPPPAVPFVAEPLAMMVPFGRMLTSCMLLASYEATRARGWDPAGAATAAAAPASIASTALAPASLSSPPCAAEPLCARVPFERMSKSCRRPGAAFAATRALARLSFPSFPLPPPSPPLPGSTAAPEAPASAGSMAAVAEPLAARVPFGKMSTSCTLLLSFEDTRARAMPPASNGATSTGRYSSNPPPCVAQPASESEPSGRTWISWMPCSPGSELPLAATSAYALPFM